MANFKIAEAITGRNEGQYANNPDDKGKETYAGIARNFWGNWEGWKIIDAFKSEYKNMVSNNKPSLTSYINKSAKVNQHLLDLISQFYKQNFWDVNKLDLISDQQLANTVYDFGVNSGTGRAAKFLQEAYNEFFDNDKLVVDGKIGNNTLIAINSFTSETIYTLFNNKRESFYRSIAKGSQAQFLKSWLSRLKPYQK